MLILPVYASNFKIRKKDFDLKNRIFYGWFICAACVLMLFISMGMVSNGFSMFLPFIREEYSLTHAQTSSLVTLRCLAAFISMIFTGVYYDKIGTRAGTAIAASFAGFAYLIYSLSSTYSGFCIGAAVSGLSYGLGSMIPVSILMNRWFIKHRALALSIAGTGTGLATIILPTVSTDLIEAVGLSKTFGIECAFVFIAVAVIFLVIKKEPESIGLVPLGADERVLAAADAESAAKEKEQHNISDTAEKSALPSELWAMLIAASLMMGAVANPGFTHLSVLYTTAGFDAKHVAAIIGFTGLVILASKPLFGEITDKIGGRKSSIICGAILVAGHALCCSAYLGSGALSIATMLVLGIGYPLVTIGPSVWANDMATRDAYPVVIRRLQISYAGGALLFSNIPGILADHFGNYIPAYLMFTLLMLASTILVIAAYRYKKRKME